jgi:acetylglutamate kinase
MTTDTRVKLTSRTVSIGGKDVTLACICKGSGMIAPSLATMIAVVATDCAIKPHVLGSALQQAMRRSFNALTVDGDMSTNDCVIALANGAAGNAPIADPGPALDAFAAALDDLCRQMAREIAADGEGATKLLDITVEGTPAEEMAQDLAKACAGSSLVKAAIFGADPN